MLTGKSQSDTGILDNRKFSYLSHSTSAVDNKFGSKYDNLADSLWIKKYESKRRLSKFAHDINNILCCR